MRAHDTINPSALKRLKILGKNIRIARLNRNYSAEKLAKLAGTNRETLRRIETGHPGVGIGFVVSVLWALQLDEDLELLAAPSRDALGMKLATPDNNRRARKSKDEDKYNF